MAGKPKIDPEKLFKEVLKHVKNGIGIKEACLIVGQSGTATLYRVLTDEQKWELNSYKALHVKAKRQGIGTKIRLN
jgi:hypothetical protein